MWYMEAEQQGMVFAGDREILDKLGDLAEDDEECSTESSEA
ncbi:hypothetical protein [Brevibacillus reuszeri]|nr:hypothetical protein [Brevibacillus reuszeri]